MSDQRRVWMYERRQNPDKFGVTAEFMAGVQSLVDLAKEHPSHLSEGQIRCPCKKCRNRRFQKEDDLKVHLYKHGFMPDYTVWTSHGEIRSHDQGQSAVPSGTEEVSDDDEPTMCDMVYDAAGPSFDPEEPNEEARGFYKLFRDADTPLYEGCPEESPLSLITELLNTKSDFNMSQECYNRILSLINRILSKGTNLPKIITSRREW
nr:hypothetical protein [Serratia marcescens]